MIDYIFDNLAIGNVEDARNAPSSITALLCVAEEIRFPDLMNGVRLHMRYQSSLTSLVL
jgi:hypothetical protein